MVAIRENELRAALLGYDVRLYKLGIFTIGGAMAGLAGLLFANCVFVSPTMFTWPIPAQIIIWVIVGGLGTLFGPVVGCILLQTLTTWAGTLPAQPQPRPRPGPGRRRAGCCPRGLLPTLGLARSRAASEARMTALLATEGLTMRFGGVVAVDHVTSPSQEGELRCLIGPNGAGKSTFFKCLTGQLGRPPAGCFWRGADVAGLEPHRDRPARHRHQDPGALAVRRADACWRACWLGVRRKHGEREARRAGAGTRSSGSASPTLAGRAGRPLAHGQRQLVELAMVVAPEPDLIILDEPTAGMTRRGDRRAPPR